MDVKDKLNYCIDIIRYSLYSSPEIKRPNRTNIDVGVEVDPKEIENGSMRSDMAMRLIHAYRSKLLSRREGEESKDLILNSAPVLVAPIIIKEKSKLVYLPLCWIPAKVGKNGILQVDSERKPWFDRRFLEPTEYGNVSIGLFDDYESVADKVPLTDRSWHGVLEYIENIFRTITGFSLCDWKHEGYQREPTRVLIDEELGSGPAITLLKLAQGYDESLPDLLQTALNGTREPNAVPPLEDSAIECLHLGHLSTRPTNTKQRDVVRCAGYLPSGQLLAINGPPGTGKTTVLQSVIANYVVQFALEGNHPPLIAATSYTNQALKNLLESVSGSFEDSKKLIGQRWVDFVDGIGVFIASKSAAKDVNKNVQLYDNIFDIALDASKSQQRKDFFLENFNKWYGSDIESLDIAKSKLHAHLKILVEKIGKWAACLSELSKQRYSNLNDVRTELTRLVEECASLKSTVQHLDEEFAIASKEFDSLESAFKRVFADLKLYHTQRPFWQVIFEWLPLVKRLQAERLHARAMQLDGELVESDCDFATAEKVLDILSENHRLKVESKQKKLKKLKFEIEQTRHLIDQQTTEYQCLEQLLDQLALLMNPLFISQWDGVDKLGVSNINQVSDIKILFDLVDITLRREAFYTAMRYWEVRALLNDPNIWGVKGQLKTGRTGKLERFRHLAMLTPCFVATVYKLADQNFFGLAYQGRGKGQWVPFKEALDLLIIEEAGQVNPELGIPLIGLAKRAVVIGDDKQLQPIASVSEEQDMSRIEDEATFAELKSAGILGSSGSMIRLAQYATVFSDQDVDVPGLMLRDHWRCAPKLIAFCNTTFYNDALIPKTQNPNHIWQPLSYAHIRSKSSARGTSWQNQGEAYVIADWLARNKKNIEDLYQEPLYKTVGVLTPYKAQRSCIRQALIRFGVEEKQIKQQERILVGTVSALQGAERQIILFSPVASSAEFRHRTPLFDRVPYLLNVAVSRAKHHFMLFGDMNLFRQDNSVATSSKLAKFLYEDEANRLTDVTPLFALENISRGFIATLTNYNEHDQEMHEILKDVKKKLLICSPFMHQYAVDRSGCLNGFKKAKERGVKLIVVTDNRFNRKWQHKANEAMSSLTAVGVEVWRVANLHAKTVCMDENLIIEGSFNWFSASRNPRRANTERSLVYRGSDTRNFVEAAWEEISTKEPIEVWGHTN